MDAIRKQLDVLMGANRNGDVTEVSRKYYDRDVCRLFLAGLCPHDLFQLTKMDMGPCPKIHSLQLRKEYPFFLLNIYIFFYFRFVSTDSCRTRNSTKQRTRVSITVNFRLAI
uniref:LUC7 related protein n=1 Tax=Musa acuminata subsp. malaccensis TaxID=214687 RepID=A0A804IQ87_MUSAM|nr:PREDICTED: U1 snRNP-associated protein usp106-like [Musa acuminata subsp. malaccensis]